MKDKPSYTSVKGNNMSEELQSIAVSEQKPNDKEYNFRAFEAKMKKELEAEREKNQLLQKELEERITSREVEEDNEPYVDNKKLHRELNNFGKKAKEESKTEIKQVVQQAIYEERKQAWLDNNPDFFEVMEKSTPKFMERAPEVAKTILQMPDNFERAKLVYHNIKALGLDKPEQKQTSIQEKIDANRRSPFYQPSGVASAPYAAVGDFSSAGQKNAYEKMKEAQSKLRI